jgi:hypothetical protein
MAKRSARIAAVSSTIANAIYIDMPEVSDGYPAGATDSEER